MHSDPNGHDGRSRLSPPHAAPGAIPSFPVLRRLTDPSRAATESSPPQEAAGPTEPTADGAHPTTDSSAAPRPSGPLLLDWRAATAYLGISRTRLFDLQREGVLQGVRVGGRRLWRRVDLERFVSDLDPER